MPFALRPAAHEGRARGPSERVWVGLGIVDVETPRSIAGPSLDGCPPCTAAAPPESRAGDASTAERGEIDCGDLGYRTRRPRLRVGTRLLGVGCAGKAALVRMDVSLVAQVSGELLASDW
jgi:hypothetical protein